MPGIAAPPGRGLRHCRNVAYKLQCEKGPVQELAIVYCRHEDGRIPFQEWLDSIRDLTIQIRIRTRLTRVASGNLGDVRDVGGGVFELRLAFGPGYRIYGARERHHVVLFLCGGDKSTQRKDIVTAKEYHARYRARQR